MTNSDDKVVPIGMIADSIYFAAFKAAEAAGAIDPDADANRLLSQLSFRGDGGVVTAQTPSGEQVFRGDAPPAEIVAAFAVATETEAATSRPAPNMVDDLLARNRERAAAPNALRP